MRERLTTLDWQREMLGEVGMGPAAMPSAVGAGAFARPIPARPVRRRERHGQLTLAALPMALDARLEAGLVAICATMMQLGIQFVREELRDMAHHPGWTAFFLVGIPLLLHYVGFLPVLLVMLWLTVDSARHSYGLTKAHVAADAPPLPVDVGPGASVNTRLIGLMLAMIGAEMLLDMVFLALATLIEGWLWF